MDMFKIPLQELVLALQPTDCLFKFSILLVIVVHSILLFLLDKLNVVAIAQMDYLTNIINLLVLIYGCVSYQHRVEESTLLLILVELTALIHKLVLATVDMYKL